MGNGRKWKEMEGNGRKSEEKKEKRRKEEKEKKETHCPIVHNGAYAQ